MESSKTQILFTYRFLILVLLAGSYMCIEMVQSAIGMAIICMVDPKYLVDDDQNSNDTTVSDCYSNTSEPTYDGTLQWTIDQQSLILACFQFGVLLSPFTGWLGDKVNVKWLLTIAVALTALCGASIPLLAPYSYIYVVCARILMGLGEAILVPAVNCLIARWFPQNERNFAVGIAYGGRQIGTLTILPLAGFFCARTYILGGWPATFYVAAMVGSAWTCLWLIFGDKDPFAKSFCISDNERTDLRKRFDAESTTVHVEKAQKTPWRKLLKSPAVWAVAISVVCQEFPQITQALFFPSYLKDVFYVSSTINGLASALPALCLWLGRIFAAKLADTVQKRMSMSKTKTSKIFNSIGALGVGVFYISTALLNCHDSIAAVVLLSLAMTCCGFHTAGCLEAIVSMAPEFSGVITGMAYFFISVTGIINPIMTKAITAGGTQLQWDLIFLINAIISFIPLVVFNIWGKAEPQSFVDDDIISSTKLVERF